MLEKKNDLNYDYINSEALKGFKGWRKDGLEFLLTCELSLNVNKAIKLKLKEIDNEKTTKP